jgi:hypothetical protein
MNWETRSMDVFFLTPKKQMLNGQLTAWVKASGKALEGLPDTSSSQVSDCDGRSPGSSVMDGQKHKPGSPQKKDIHAPSESTSSYLKQDAHAPFKTLAQTRLPDGGQAWYARGEFYS